MRERKKEYKELDSFVSEWNILKLYHTEYKTIYKLDP